MSKTPLALIAVLALGACGGTRYASTNAVTYTPPPASAPVASPAAAPIGTTNAAASVPTPVPAPVALPFARGPIQKACQSSDRKARSAARCGCIQAVADKSLSSAQQRRGASYWKNPAKLQEVRQSDNPNNEQFWKAWKAYGQSAAAICKNS